MRGLQLLRRAGAGRGWRGHAAAASAEPTPTSKGPPAVSGALQQRRERDRIQSISVHKGLKIQAALCVERPPLEVLEPDFKKRWRAFKEAWELRTNNALTIQDEIVYMRFYFHFLGDKAAVRRLSGEDSAQVLSGSGASGAAEDEEGAAEAARNDLAKVLVPTGEAQTGLDKLIAGEGLDLAFPQPRRRSARRKRAAQGPREVAEESGARSLKRLSAKSLFLLVRYAGGWTFPKVDRVHGQAMREALLRLCARQLGDRFEPYIVGACPFTYRKLRSDLHPGIQGRKVFYYRARHVPGQEILLPNDSSVSDWAWCSREELPHYLGIGEWCAVRECLPLDDIKV